MANPNSMDSHVDNKTDWEQVELASFGQRLATCILDIGFFYGLVALLGVVLGALGQTEALKQANPYLVGFLLMSAYYLPQEWLTGRTLGKWLTGTQAINDDGSDLTFLRAAARTVCRFIPFEIFSFLFAGPDGIKDWHDRIPGTLVITLRKTEKPSTKKTWQS